MWHSVKLPLAVLSTTFYIILQLISLNIEWMFVEIKMLKLGTYSNLCQPHFCPETTKTGIYFKVTVRGQILQS